MKKVKENTASIPVKENFIAGLVGAFLFSLAGGAVWYLLYQVGFIAGISGIIGVVCAIVGYRVFARKESIKGVIFASIIAVLVIVLAWYLCLATDVFKAHKDWYANGEIDYMPTFAECVRYGYTFLEEPEIAKAYYADLGIGLLFCVIGAFASVRNAIARIKAERNAAKAAAAIGTAAETPAAVEAPAVETPAEEAPAVENDGKWVCGKCGAKNAGDVCEFCDSPKE